MFECINTEKCIKFAAVFISESGQIRYETSLGFFPQNRNNQNTKAEKRSDSSSDDLRVANILFAILFSAFLASFIFTSR